VDHERIRTVGALLSLESGLNVTALFLTEPCSENNSHVTYWNTLIKYYTLCAKQNLNIGFTIHTPLPLSMAFIFSSRFLHFASSSLHMPAKTAGETWHSPVITHMHVFTPNHLHHFFTITPPELTTLQHTCHVQSVRHSKGCGCVAFRVHPWWQFEVSLVDPPLQWCRLPKIQAFCHVATHYFGQFSALLKLLLFFNFTSGPKSNKGYACRDSGLLSSPMTSSMGSFMLLLGLLRVLEHYSSSKLIE